MALRRNEIKPYAEFLNEELSSRHIGKLCLFSGSVYSFSLSRGGKLVFVLTGGDPYVYISPSFLEGNSLSSPFASFLRKSLSNALIESVSQYNDDRILDFALTSLNEVFKPVKLHLLFELLPTHPNLILLDEKGRILSAHKTSSLLDKRAICHGLTYLPPEASAMKLEQETTCFSAPSFNAHCLEKENLLCEKRKKERFAHLFKYLKTREKALSRKIKQIEEDQEEAKAHLEDGRYGGYIYTNYSSLPQKGQSLVFEGKEIPLDPRKNLAQNADAFYKRAKKAKTAIEKEEENKKKAIKEKEQISSLLGLLDNADESFLLLSEKEYGLNKVEKKGVSATELSSSSLLPYEVKVDGVSYVFGKNAKQNDFLSFAYLTNKSYLWLHVKGDHGAHLIIKKEDPSGEVISLGCELALLASKKEDGEVMYCPRKNVKRGNVPGQAIVSEYRSATFKRISAKAKNAFLTAQKVK